jgi:histidinol dehydrogenase
LRGATSEGELSSLLPSPELAGEGPVDAVRQILSAVKDGGDRALRELSVRFDGVEPARLRVPAEEIAGALRAVTAELREALSHAARAIRMFHEAERAAHQSFEVASPEGIVTREILLPVGRAGCYVPGGRAPLA